MTTGPSIKPIMTRGLPLVRVIKSVSLTKSKATIVNRVGKLALAQDYVGALIGLTDQGIDDITAPNLDYFHEGEPCSAYRHTPDIQTCSNGSVYNLTGRH